MHIFRIAPRRLSTLGRVIFVFLLGLCGPVAAASFQCEKARADVEKAVCAGKALSTKDARLDGLYRRLLADGGAERLRAGQSAWLAGLPRDCAQGSGFTTCLLQAYTKRISLLERLLQLRDAARAPRQRNTGYRHAFTSISKKYDFVLQLLERCETTRAYDTGNCEAPGVLSIFKKGGRLALQAIPMENIFVSFSESAEPLTNSSKLYDYQGVINVGDFNFDGEEDFAIQNGNEGSYGSPSYDVYLKAGKGRSFVYSPALSDLIANSLGFFQFDPRSKRLKAFFKSGCCYHVSMTLKVVRGLPVPVSRIVDEAHVSEGLVYEERWERGKWRRISTRRYRPESYCEDVLQTLAKAHFNYGTDSEHIEQTACNLVYGEKEVGVFATYYPKRDVVDDLHVDDQYTGLDVLLGDMRTPSALATYREPMQFLRGKAASMVIDAAPYPIHPGRRVFGVRNGFYLHNDGGFERLNLFEQSGETLLNVLRNVITRAETPTESLRRVVAIDKTSAHFERRDILIEETRTFKAVGKKRAAPARQKRAYRLEFNGREYELPEALTALP